MCHQHCYGDIIASMEMFKMKESSLSNHKIRVYVRFEPTSVGTSYCLIKALFK